MRLALVVLGARSAGLAARLKEALPGSSVHAPALADGPADVRFAKVVPHLQALFEAGTPIVGLCASGILIRALAPLLGDKRSEPPVLALAEDGSAVVPLLGGHRGANALGRSIARTLGIAPAITTAGDLRLGLALDEPPPGWALSDRDAAKGVMARLLEGEAVRIVADEGVDAGWLSPLPQLPEARLTIRATLRAGQSGDLVCHPRQLALGIGCERDADAHAVAALALSALAEAGLSPQAVASVVSIDLKAAEPAIHALAERLGVPARFFPAERLLEETPRLTAPSEAVFRATGCWGVAEGAALAAAGADGRLLVPKRVGARATCAVALALAPLDPTTLGRPQGRLALVGLGPGTPDWRTAEAERHLALADDLVGYDLYLDLAPARAGQARHPFPIGAERERCLHALRLAAQGRQVALLASGDPGIYALATLVLELLETGEAGWRRIALSVSPGVSALQAAAARAGAPLGHDFCAVSLSDLLTPWAAIERRLKAAAAGDFVVALYNPVSLRRREQINRARDILMAARPAGTPVIIGRNLGRADETVQLLTLGELEPDRVDMLSIVLVGSSTTRRFPKLHGGEWVYTPRGYEAG